MKPCPAESAATLLAVLATLPSPTLLFRADVAAAIERVPLVHPMRAAHGQDRCVEMARAVRSGRETADQYHPAYPAPEAMRAFAAELRAGAEAMRAQGWGWMVGGAL